MPKMKTHQATAKRFRMTRNKKLLHRKGGQDHFNSRESGKTTRAKRNDQTMHQSSAQVFHKLMPYQ